MGVEKEEEAWRKEGQGQKGGCEGKRNLRKSGGLTGEMEKGLTRWNMGGIESEKEIRKGEPI